MGQAFPNRGFSGARTSIIEATWPMPEPAGARIVGPRRQNWTGKPIAAAVKSSRRPWSAACGAGQFRPGCLPRSRPYRPVELGALLAIESEKRGRLDMGGQRRSAGRRSVA
jgi:hypothetical protein